MQNQFQTGLDKNPSLLPYAQWPVFEYSFKHQDIMLHYNLEMDTLSSKFVHCKTFQPFLMFAGYAKSMEHPKGAPLEKALNIRLGWKVL
jgi:hypothetical protein